MQIIRIGQCEFCGASNRLIKIEVPATGTFYSCDECVVELMSAPFPCVQKLTAKEDN